ncbi:hypothetical protein F2P56_035571 [Juglans regia]|uniref:Uncharacterized protein LOC108998132 n=3 Tax=Juglans regia TaxID=51240 RepID=A0A2I4FEQ0_JUGRE|nr:uncharacterized protein LOC108998132 [Juglans regia]XP_035542657.1 uncharacterized protein LOC108998132 [Juglans regia]KAF5442966.1 hypothetical protein F2P56_035571 [Juglans regia]
MAKIQNKSHQTKPKATHFLCCYFGSCSSWASEKGSVETLRTDGQKINMHWLSWSRLIQTKKSGTKPAPLESTLNEKSDPKREILASGSKPDMLTSMPREAPVTDHKLPSQVPVFSPVPLDQRHEALGGPQETTYERTAQKHVQDFERTDTSKEDMFQNWLSCRRKKEAMRQGYSHPGSPKPKTKPLVVMSHSVSLPVSRHEKGAIPISSSLTNSRAVSKNLDREKGSISAKKLDSAVGLSIVVVTLIIMLVWGRVCAILSTSAWLYFVPRLVEQNRNRHDHDQDYDSEEHKKKVVLEGFLERNHRSPL